MADVITMGLILHDWKLERKKQLIKAAYALAGPRRVVVPLAGPTSAAIAYK